MSKRLLEGARSSSAEVLSFLTATTAAIAFMFAWRRPRPRRRLYRALHLCAATSSRSAVGTAVVPCVVRALRHGRVGQRLKASAESVQQQLSNVKGDLQVVVFIFMGMGVPRTTEWRWWDGRRMLRAT